MTHPARRLFQSRWRAAGAGLLGALGGAAYAHFIGCRTGTCPLTSNVWIAAAWFGLIAAFAAWPSGAPAPQAGEAAGDRG